MTKIEDFLIYCSGADRSTLERCATDRNKYVGIGATIFFTGVLAFFSSGYALYTVFDAWWAAILFGTVWGMMIFNLDRYIVMSMKSRGQWWRDLWIALPRIGLAVLLAIVISKPLELKIFEKEINSELVQMEQEVYKKQEDRVKERFDGRKTELTAQIETLKNEISAKTAYRDTLVRSAVQEADGTGGSGIRNMGPIYRAKKAEAEQAAIEADRIMASHTPLLAQKELELHQTDSLMRAEITQLERSRFNGMAARMEALDRLATQSAAIRMAVWFIMLLFIAIETAPVLVKLISERSPYDYLLYDQEHIVEAEKSEVIALRKNATQSRIKYDTEARAHLTIARTQAEKTLIDQKTKEKLNELQQQPYQWGTDKWNG